MIFSPQCIVVLVLLCFFFSSRRRHTIFKCDWSSDVCSSDLDVGGGDDAALEVAGVDDLEEQGAGFLDEESRSLLFEVINARYLKGSIITTSHVGIASWAERLGDRESGV